MHMSLKGGFTPTKKVDLPNFEVFHLLLLYPMESFEPESILMVSFKRNLYPIMKNLNIQNCQNMLPEIQMHTGIDFEQLLSRKYVLYF